MRKELYYKKDTAERYAQSFAEDVNAIVRESSFAVADDNTTFDYIGRDMNAVGEWSGELAGYEVVNENGEVIAIFAYYE